MSQDQSPGPPWTILKILRWTTGYLEEKGSATPRLDAELLLSEVLDLERIALYTQFDRPLEGQELDAYRGLIKRRVAGEPVAYILGHREFWTLDLKVDPRVLIPRPDTETLVRAALERIDEDSTQRLVDVGTGSGAVALAIASERPDLRIAAIDDSAEALEVAVENARIHDLQDRVTYLEGDLLSPLTEDWLPLDFVVSNPPYISEAEGAEISREVKDFEPRRALFAGVDGLDVIERLIDEAWEKLAPRGWLLFEIGYRQGQAVCDLLASTEFEDVQVIKDYGDQDRVVAARRPAQ